MSRYYVPRWSLAAFYYRQGNKEEFIRWANLALSVGTGVPESLFQMALRLDIPPGQILDNLLPAVPERVESYLQFLRAQGKVEQEYDVAAHLIRIGSPVNRRTVLETCESLFIAGKMDQAVALWNGAIEAHWLARSPLDPLLGRSLGNDSFSREPLDLGFDWKTSIPIGCILFAIAGGP